LSDVGRCDWVPTIEKIDEKEIHQALKIFKRLAKKLAKNLQRFS
jgi:hypothetical protein